MVGRKIVLILSILVCFNYAVIRRGKGQLMMGTHYEKHVRQSHQCGTHHRVVFKTLQGIAYSTHESHGIDRLWLLGYNPVQHVPKLKAAGTCNVMCNAGISKHRKSTVQMPHKTLQQDTTQQHTCVEHLP